MPLLPFTPRRRLLSLTTVVALCLGVAAGAGASGLPLPIPADAQSRRVSVISETGLTATAQLPTEELRAARRAMNAGDTLPPDTLRALADRRDGLAAWRLTKHLLQTGGTASDIAHYAAIAAGQGRVYALQPMIDAMHLMQPGAEPPARLNALIQVLYAHAWGGNGAALDAVIDFNGEGRLLGALTEATRQRILEHAGPQGGRIELRLALNLLDSETLSAADLARATGWLEQAAQSDNLAVMTTARNLLALLKARTAQADTTTN